jgi:hypothetical protein
MCIPTRDFGQEDASQCSARQVEIFAIVQLLKLKFVQGKKKEENPKRSS